MIPMAGILRVRACRLDKPARESSSGSWCRRPEQRVGVHRLPPPPLLLGPELVGREMQVRRTRRVAGAANVPDEVALSQRMARDEARREAIEMRVVVGEAALGIVLVDREAA